MVLTQDLIQWWALVSAVLNASCVLLTEFLGWWMVLELA